MRVLATGIDSLVLAVDVVWKDKAFLESLERLKDRAKVEDKPCPGAISYRASEIWLCNVEPYGMRGYEWVLRSKEFTLRLGNFVESKALPSVMVEYSSEALWGMGVAAAWEMVQDLLEENGAQILSVKVSRADLSCDILFSAVEWEADKLKSSRVTRAKSVKAFWGAQDRLETFGIGQGDIQARLYDKAREIEAQSKKVWMYDIWKISEVDRDKVVVRIEFQIRRTILKEMGVGSFEEFMNQIERVWRYCTVDWLQFKDGNRSSRPELRNTLPWWEQVQSNFLGVQGGEPVVRRKALRMDEDMLWKETMGFLSSLTAVKLEKKGAGALEFEAIEKNMRGVIASLHVEGASLRKFQESVIRKRAMYRRGARG